MAKPTTVPTWDSTAANLTTPGGEQTTGWHPSQAPSAQIFNWFMHHAYKWIDWLANLETEVLEVQGLQASANIGTPATVVAGQVETDSIILPAWTTVSSESGWATTVCRATKLTVRELCLYFVAETSGTSAQVMTLPSALYPTATRYFTGARLRSGAYSTVVFSVTGAGVVTCLETPAYGDQYFVSATVPT
jgi:hypothetical protein